ncbi:MAG: DUF4258 domain-containing protein [Phycisphaerae bacterium]
MNIRDITDAIHGNRVRVTEHADEEAANDALIVDEICHSALHGEIIEDYPSDRPYPSCLVYGRTSGGDPVHSVWGYNDATKWAVLITVYRPDPDRWVDWRQRRRR